MTARGATLLIAVVLVIAPTPVPGPVLRPQDRSRPPGMLPAPVLPDTAVSIDRYVRENVDLFETNEFRARKTVRRKFQRAGYANTLHDVLAFDAVGALLSFIRTRLQIEYSLPHNTIWFRTDAGVLMPLPEDWTFPADPWKD